MHTCIPSYRSVNAGNKHTQHAPSMKTECDYLNGWIKKVTYAKISPQMVNPRDILHIAGEGEEEEVM